jgi:hypothetical protein
VRSDAREQIAHLRGVPQIERVPRRNVVKQVVRHRSRVQPEHGALLRATLEENTAILTGTPDDDHPPH